IDETDWVDGVVPPGTDFVYRLVLVASDGRHVLGDLRFSNPSPARFRVLGATPNPFNPATRIPFEPPRPGAVAVVVTDVRGRVLRRFAAAFAETGEHSVTWNARDDRGTLLPSGLYLYEIRSSGWTGRGRMTLAK